MRKSFWFCLVILLTATCFAYAEMPRENTGCGLGSMAFQGKDGLVFQVLAATTNGSFGNQTFGISSGTLECEKAPSFASNEQLNRFVAENMDNLAHDIALGQGEYLDTLAELMAVQDRARFASTLQENFENIFPSQTVGHVHVIEQIVIATNLG